MRSLSRRGSAHVPDFAWEDAKVAVYCDGFAVHGKVETLELDAGKRNVLQARGWAVLTYWGRTILRDADGCAEEIVQVVRGRRKQTAGGAGPSETPLQ
jgi:very-short-patch-repair endonuclease